MQVLPHTLGLCGGNRVFVAGEVFDDGPNRKLTVLLLPTPKIVDIRSVVRVSVGGRGIMIFLCPVGQLRFLLGRKKEIAVGFDRQIPAVFLLESAIGATLTIERVKVVYIKLKVGERLEKGPGTFTEKVRVAEVKLGCERGPG